MVNTFQVSLELPLETYRKIMAYAEVCTTEITGFADLEYDAEKECLVAGEVYLLDQHGGGADVHIEEEDISKWTLEMIKKGKTQLPRLWWHSHVNMGVFLSGTDEDTLVQLQNDSFILALVVNKSRQMKAKMYVAVSVPMLGTQEQIAVEDVPVRVAIEYAEVPKAIEKEVEKKVNQKKASWPKKIWKTWEPDEDVKDKDSVLYLDKNTEKKIAKALYLPKDPEEAWAKVEKLGLSTKWDYKTQDYYYEDPASGDVWIDYWESLDKYMPIRD